MLWTDDVHDAISGSIKVSDVHPTIFRRSLQRHCFATEEAQKRSPAFHLSHTLSSGMASPPRAGLDAHRASIDVSRGASLPPLERAALRKRFMVAVDGSTSSLQALMHAAELCKEGDEITIVTVSAKVRTR